MPSDLAALDNACDALETPNMAGMPDMLVNDNRAGGRLGESCHERKRERPEHREIVLLRMLGYTARDIAERTGYTPAGVNQILRQPWARQRILDNLHKSHAELQKLLQAEAAESLLHQIELRNDPNTAPAIRARICDSILDRALGKPMQMVDITKRDAPALPDNEAELRERLAKLQEEERQLRGN